MTTTNDNLNKAPYPVELHRIIDRLQYKKDWTFYLRHLDRGQGSEGLTLIIQIHTIDSYHQNNPPQWRTVNHYMPVPPAAFEARTWQRWVLDQILLVEQHEACEFFVVDGEHPYAPNHGPGRNPYVITEVGTELDAATSFRGEVNAS